MSGQRCAIYTRKSSDEGLDQAFNSLDAQREACEAYIASQRHEGWRTIKDRFDDGGLSGGTLERPALQTLLADIDAGRIDMIVVYKIDRLTRSLSDFAKLVDRLDAAGASFVSVTQQFNTSTSMGRLTLNVLLSFAQFEREVTAERIRDKIAASKKKGIWMGGQVPLGYDKSDTGLTINDREARAVRQLFETYLELGCVRRLKTFADQQGLRTKTRTTKAGKTVEGTAFSRGRLYHLLSNPIYIGRIRHGSDTYPGLHEAILSPALWDQVQAKLQANAIARRSRRNANHPSPLAGKLFDETGARLTPSHATKQGRRYRYYISVSKHAGTGSPEGWRLPARELETVVFEAISADREVQLSFAEHSREMPTPETCFDLIERIDLSEHELLIRVKVPGEKTAVVRRPFQHRRRGVETRLVLGNTPSRAPDLVLIRRIRRAMNWVDRIKSGETVASIAASEDITGGYITKSIDLAFLSPEILTAIAEGRQRPDLSTKSLTRIKWPADWRQQTPYFLS